MRQSYQAERFYPHQVPHLIRVVIYHFSEDSLIEFVRCESIFYHNWFHYTIPTTYVLRPATHRQAISLQNRLKKMGIPMSMDTSEQRVFEIREFYLREAGISLESVLADPYRPETYEWPPYMFANDD